MKKTSTFSKAVQLMASGFSIIPVGLNKRPLLPTWKKYQTEAADDEQLSNWWEKHPEANIGIVTGKISGITVIDLDVDEKGEVRTPIETFPPTFTVRTGNGGYHLYYKYQQGLTVSANAYPQFPGVDIRNDGGFVVGPYSETSYKDEKTGKKKGGKYEVIKNISPVAFPEKLFGGKKLKGSVSSKLGVSKGGRNDTITSFIGQLLQAEQNPERWETEVWPAVQRANKTYAPPLGERELRTSFESICKKETERRATLIMSPIQLEGNGQEVEIKIRKNRMGIAYKDMANVLAVLSQHPYYKDTLRYNEFRQEIEYNGKAFEESDLIKIQYFMQVDAELHGVTKEAVYSAVSHYAHQNKYDEAVEWVTSLEWDGVPRLENWIHKATGVEDDDYHSGIGAQWMMGLIRRIMFPGTTFDYVLVLVGGQGIGKTSFFRIMGGPWYKSYTGAMDNKDFYLALRGAVIVDLDEGAALYRSEAIKIKSIITETHDEYRAPYDRVMKKYPRRFVFSMSTNDTEPFRDVTGNRRYWTIDAHETINFKWLEENRDQLYAEAYHALVNKTKLQDVPMEKALENQERHLPDDSWTDIVRDEVFKSHLYREGSFEYATTIPDVFRTIFPDENLARLGKSQEMRISNIFKNVLGLEKRRLSIEGERQVRWMLTPKKAAELQAKPARDSRDAFDKFGETE